MSLFWINVIMYSLCNFSRPTFKLSVEKNHLDIVSVIKKHLACYFKHEHTGDRPGKDDVGLDAEDHGLLIMLPSESGLVIIRLIRRHQREILCEK